METFLIDSSSLQKNSSNPNKKLRIKIIREAANSLDGSYNYLVSSLEKTEIVENSQLCIQQELVETKSSLNDNSAETDFIRIGDSMAEGHSYVNEDQSKFSLKDFVVVEKTKGSGNVDLVQAEKICLKPELLS